MGFIYKITNKVNQKVYIGQTTRSVDSRWKEHQWDSNNPLRDNGCNYFHNAIRKYGATAFYVEEIEKCDDHLLNIREKYWIKHYNSYNNSFGYNSTSGGDNCYERRLESRDTKARKSAVQLGENNSFFGKHHSNEHRSKISTPVVAYTDDGVVFAYYVSQISATADGFQQSHITSCAHGKTRHHGVSNSGERLCWRFASQDESKIIISYFLNTGIHKLSSLDFNMCKEVA